MAKGAKIEIILTATEKNLASLIGYRRYLQKLRDGVKPLHGQPWQTVCKNTVDGAVGEFVVSKYTGIPWDPKIGDYSKGDVGPYEVRTTPKETNRLWFYETDKSESRFVLVTGFGLRFIIHGWLFGWEGKQAKYWQDPQGTGRHNYYVPHYILRDIATLEINRVRPGGSQNRTRKGGISGTNKLNLTYR